MDEAVTAFTDNIEYVFQRYCSIVDTGAKSEPEQHFFEISRLAKDFQSKFQERLQVVASLVKTHEPSEGNSKDVEARVTMLYLVLVFVDLSFDSVMVGTGKYTLLFIVITADREVQRTTKRHCRGLESSSARPVDELGASY